MHWPAGIKARGELRRTPGHVIDIAPTILDVIGVEKPAEWKGDTIPPAPGRSLKAAFGRDVVIERPALWWMHEGNKAVRAGDWKLVAAKGDPWELYDLKTDRAESKNLAAQNPDKAKELEALWSWQLKEITRLAAKPAKRAAPKRKRPARKTKAK
jgi:arylsulfatase A-like enzyme